MTILQEEKRKTKRLDTFWLAFDHESDKFLGYLKELSSDGLKIWLRSSIDLHEPTIIKICPPNELGVDVMDFTVQKIWMEKNNERKIYEMGCEFLSLNDRQKDNINKLIGFFHEEKNRFFDDLENALRKG